MVVGVNGAIGISFLLLKQMWRGLVGLREEGLRKGLGRCLEEARSIEYEGV